MFLAGAEDSCLHISESKMAEENYLENALTPACAKDKQIVVVEGQEPHFYLDFV